MNIRKLVWEKKWEDFWCADGSAVGFFQLTKDNSRTEKPWVWSCEISAEVFVQEYTDTYEEAKSAADKHFELHAKLIISDLQEQQNDN